MSEGITIAIIGAVTTVISSLLGYLIKQVNSLKTYNQQVNEARLEKEIAYEDYDRKIKKLALQHATSYLIGNDKAKLKSAIAETTKAKEAYQREELEYNKRLIQAVRERV